METIRIDDPADARIAAFRDIRERDLARQGDFIAEGTVVLDHLLTSSRFEPTALLISDHRIAGLARRLDDLSPTAPVYVASQDIMNMIAGFSVHRGVLAHGRRRADLPPIPGAADLGEGPVLVAAGLSNHDNLGALFRNAAAFGIKAIVLDALCCDPLYRKCIRVSVGTVLKVPYYRLGPAGEALDHLESHGFSAVALSPAGRLRLDAWQPGGRVALVLGTEGQGLPAEVLARCTGLGIAMAGGIDSLNVATAGAIAMHHLFTRGGRPS